MIYWTGFFLHQLYHNSEAQKGPQNHFAGVKMQLNLNHILWKFMYENVGDN